MIEDKQSRKYKRKHWFVLDVPTAIAAKMLGLLDDTQHKLGMTTDDLVSMSINLDNYGNTEFYFKTKEFRDNAKKLLQLIRKFPALNHADLSAKALMQAP